MFMITPNTTLNISLVTLFSPLLTTTMLPMLIALCCVWGFEFGYH